MAAILAPWRLDVPHRDRSAPPSSLGPGWVGAVPASGPGGPADARIHAVPGWGQQNRSVDGKLTAPDGTEVTATTDEVESRLHAGTPFWLDLDGVDDEARTVLSATFGFHPLIVRDAGEFGRRPRFDEYDDTIYLVVHGPPRPDGTPQEVHIFYGVGYLVTIHQGPCPVTDGVHHRLQRHPVVAHAERHVAVLYLVVDELVDQFFPVLSKFDDDIDDLEDAILADPTEEQLAQLFQMKRQLVHLRKLVTPQRDMFGSLASGVTTLPGMDDSGVVYLRDLYDHLIRISDLVDSYRDLGSDATDTHLSVVSNRLNVVMKQLTIIATVFLPLTFLTGFFGQNFGYLLRHITGPAVFWGLGVGVEVLAVVILMMLFRRRGWLGGPSA
jgi:magnesium transporter